MKYGLKLLTVYNVILLVGTNATLLKDANDRKPGM